MDWLYYCWLVVWNMNFIFPYIGNNHPNWRTHIFQRGRYTTNQLWHWFKKAPGTIVLCIINHSYWSYKSTFARKSVWKAWNGRSTQSLRSISELEAQHLPGRSASKKNGDPIMGYPLGYPPQCDFLERSMEKYGKMIWLVVSNMNFIVPLHIWDVIQNPLTNSSFSRWLLHHQPVMVTIKSLR